MHVLHTFLSLAPLFFTLIHSAPQPQTQNNAYSSIKPDNVVPDIDQKTLLPISQALLADSSINITITPLLNPNAKPIDPSALAAALSTLESALKTTYFGDPIAQYIPGANPALEGAFAQGRGPEGTGAQVRFGQTIAQLNTKDAPPKFTLAGLLDVVQTAQYWVKSVQTNFWDSQIEIIRVVDGCGVGRGGECTVLGGGCFSQKRDGCSISG